MSLVVCQAASVTICYNSCAYYMVGIGHAKYDVSKDEGHFSMNNVRGFDVAMVWRIPCCQRSLRKVGNVSVADGSALVQRNYRFPAEQGGGHGTR